MQDCPKDKKITASSFNFLAENLEKFRSTELYGAAPEGSTIFLRRSSLGSTAMESCRLAELSLKAIAAFWDENFPSFQAKN